MIDEYHRREKPGGGNSRTSEEENPIGTTMSVGAIMKSTVRIPTPARTSR
jgi:hypothetical protein